MSRGVWVRTGRGKLEVLAKLWRSLLGEGLVGRTLVESVVYVKCMCSGTVMSSA